MAAAAAKDLPQLSLADALELTVLVARKDPARHSRVAGPLATGVAHQEAAQTLRAMAERATSRRRSRGAA